MTCVYRYTDKTDGKIKYVGIVYGKTRSLIDRIAEHERDPWYKNGEWLIEYLESDVKTRNDAEMLEAHYIALYGTDKWYNKSKTQWGLCSYAPNLENQWKAYDDDYRPYIFDETVSAEKYNSLLKEYNSIRKFKEKCDYMEQLLDEECKLKTEADFKLKEIEEKQESFKVRIYGSFDKLHNLSHKIHAADKRLSSFISYFLRLDEHNIGSETFYVCQNMLIELQNREQYFDEMHDEILDISCELGMGRAYSHHW